MQKNRADVKTTAESLNLQLYVSVSEYCSVPLISVIMDPKWFTYLCFRSIRITALFSSAYITLFDSTNRENHLCGMKLHLLNTSGEYLWQ